MRRLAERLFDGMEDTLEEIYLSHNMLGDNLNPQFSTDEFRYLKFLRVLDLSFNGLSGISEGLLEGCDELKVSFFSWNILQLCQIFLLFHNYFQIIEIIFIGQNSDFTVIFYCFVTDAFLCVKNMFTFQNVF